MKKMSNTTEDYPCFETSAEALVYIYRKYGEDILLGQKLGAYLADYAPELSPNVMKLIKSFYTSGISDLLRKAAKGSDDDRLEAVRKSQTKLRDAFIDGHTADKIIAEFTSALGWKNVVSPADDRLCDNEREQPEIPPVPDNASSPEHSRNYIVIPTKQNAKTPVTERDDTNDLYINYVNEGLKCLYPEEEGVGPDYDEAYKLFRKAAKNGSCWGRYYVGFCLENGYGVEDSTENWEKAINWYLLSAQDHNISAICALGDAYYFGRVTYQDINEAKEYYQIAASENDSHGQYGLGMCYLKGDRVEQKEGIKWLMLAADQGYDLAKYQLGCCYSEGNGTKKDISEAVKWFYLAAIQNNYDAQYELALCYQRGRGVPQNDAEALKYFLSAANHENTNAAYYAGLMYLNGTGTRVSESEAFRLFKQAADMGHSDAQCELGKLYYYGRGAAQDITEAERLFKLSDVKGNYEAKFYAGELLYKKKDYETALKKFRRAADEGNIPAAQRMMGIYLENYDIYIIPKDDAAAFDYYYKAATGGDMEGAAHLGICYCCGIGTEKNYSKGIPWLEKAVKAGIGIAEYQLGECYYYGYGVDTDKKRGEELLRLAASKNVLYAKSSVAGIDIANKIKDISSGLTGLKAKLFKKK